MHNGAAPGFLDRRDRILQEPQDLLSFLFCSCSPCLYFREIGERGSWIVNGERDRDVGQFLEKTFFRQEGQDFAGATRSLVSLVLLL